MPKIKPESEVIEEPKPEMGFSPAMLAKRIVVKPPPWCPKKNIEFDPFCDPDNPKAVTYKDITKAAMCIKDTFQTTPLTRSHCTSCDVDINYKIELHHRTGSFHERGALYSLLRLGVVQRELGVITASTGNFAMALAYYGQKLEIPVTVVLPTTTSPVVQELCQVYGAIVLLNGQNFEEAKLYAFKSIAIKGNKKPLYINGYDHPDVIAGSGTIGLEILQQLPQTDAILVPVGGGGLIAGIATAAKHIKPNVLVYGVEPETSCCFFKALQRGLPYKTVVTKTFANTLMIAEAGANAYHTSLSLIDKLILVDEEWIARGVLRLAEEEKIIAEGAGATSLAGLLAIPFTLRELKGKTVVCVITGGNIDVLNIPVVMQRAKIAEGRIIRFIATLDGDKIKQQMRIFSMIANVGCSVRNYQPERSWLDEEDTVDVTTRVTITCETRGLQHAWTLRRVLERIFPGVFEFEERPFSPLPVCVCYPCKLHAPPKSIAPSQ